MIPTITVIPTTTVNGIHRGDKTHTQDHVTYLVNLSPMNKIVNNPANPMPLLLFFGDDATAMSSLIFVNPFLIPKYTKN